MQNRMAVLMCNLKPAKMRGVVSQAMVMCASSPEKVEILDPPSGASPGDRVTFQGFPGTNNLFTIVYLSQSMGLGTCVPRISSTMSRHVTFCNCLH